MTVFLSNLEEFSMSVGRDAHFPEYSGSIFAVQKMQGFLRPNGGLEGVLEGRSAITGSLHWGEAAQYTNVGLFSSHIVVLSVSHTQPRPSAEYSAQKAAWMVRRLEVRSNLGIISHSSPHKDPKDC